jgi:WD40 repeat protein
MGSAGPVPTSTAPATATAVPLPLASPGFTASTPNPSAGQGFPRSISAARNAPMTAVSQDSHEVELFATDGPAPRLISRFDARDDWTAAVALNPDGTLLATSGSRGTVRLWDLSTPTRPRLLQTLPHQTEYVPDLEFSPDGRMLVTGGYNNRAQTWRVVGHGVQPWITLRADTDVMAVAFDPTSRYVATATYDRVTLWDLQAPSDEQARLGGFGIYTPGQVDLSFSSDGLTLAVGTSNVTLWDLADRYEPVKGAVLKGTGPAAAFAPDSDDLATSVYTKLKGTLTLWKVTDARKVALASRPAAPGLSDSDGRTLAFAADGATLGYTAYTGFSTTLGEIRLPAS